MTVVCHGKDRQRQTGSVLLHLRRCPARNAPCRGRHACHVRDRGGRYLARNVSASSARNAVRPSSRCRPSTRARGHQGGNAQRLSWPSPTLEIRCGSAQPWLAPIESSRRLARGLPAGLDSFYKARHQGSGSGAFRAPFGQSLWRRTASFRSAPRFFRSGSGPFRPLKRRRLERRETARSHGVRRVSTRPSRRSAAR